MTNRAHTRIAKLRMAHVLIFAMLSVLLSATVASAAQQTGASAGDAGNGAKIFARNCAMCHGSQGVGMMGMHPALVRVTERLSKEEIRATIRNGRDTMPPMPAWKDVLSPQEIDDVIAYLGTLPAKGLQEQPGGGGMPMSEMMEQMMQMMGGMMGGMMGSVGGTSNMMGGYWGAVSGLIMGLLLLTLLALAGVVIYIVARRGPGGYIGGYGSEAERIAKERYARGEITLTEYEGIISNLRR